MSRRKSNQRKKPRKNKRARRQRKPSGQRTRQTTNRPRLTSVEKEKAENSSATRRVRRTRKIRQLRTEVNERVSSRRSRLTTWYLEQSRAKQVALGLVIIPIIIALILLQGVIWPLLGLVVAASKFAFVWVKGGAFVVYISYKVFKGLLGVYLCVSRSLNGWKAHKLRERQAELPSEPEAEYPAIRYVADSADPALDTSDTRLEVNTGFKQLNFSAHPALKHRVVFSYLRYFIIGQIFMYFSFWRDRMTYLTIWRAESRARVKEIFQEIGGTIFTPYLLGPHINKKRALVPGDARLVSLDYHMDQARVGYTFEVTWRVRTFKRTYPFFSSHMHQAMWSFELPCTLAELSPAEIGFQRVVAEASTAQISDVSEAHGALPIDHSDQQSRLDPSEDDAELALDQTPETT